MKNQRIFAYLILGVYFVCGLALGFTLAKNPLPRPNSVTVDIVKKKRSDFNLFIPLLRRSFTGRALFKRSDLRIQQN
jgi:hypothetical protein